MQKTLAGELRGYAQDAVSGGDTGQVRTKRNMQDVCVASRAKDVGRGARDAKREITSKSARDTTFEMQR